jgi:hypothetical protein
LGGQSVLFEGLNGFRNSMNLSEEYEIRRWRS